MIASLGYSAARAIRPTPLVCLSPRQLVKAQIITRGAGELHTEITRLWAGIRGLRDRLTLTVWVDAGWSLRLRPGSDQRCARVGTYTRDVTPDQLRADVLRALRALGMRRTEVRHAA